RADVNARTCHLRPRALLRADPRRSDRSRTRPRTVSWRIQPRNRSAPCRSRIDDNSERSLADLEVDRIARLACRLDMRAMLAAAERPARFVRSTGRRDALA